MDASIGAAANPARVIAHAREADAVPWSGVAGADCHRYARRWPA